jgi:hypothetical protein
VFKIRHAIRPFAGAAPAESAQQRRLKIDVRLSRNLVTTADFRRF